MHQISSLPKYDADLKLAVEGIITTIFGVICFFFLPSTPADASFLTDEERNAAMARMKLDAHGATNTGDVNEEHFDWRWVLMALKAPQTWLSSLIWFFVLVPLYVSPQPCKEPCRGRES